MLNKMYKLKNGFWINSKGILFDFGIDDEIIVTDCNNFSYVSNKIISVKKNDTITVFSILPIEKNGKKLPNKLASISNTNPNIFIDIVIENNCYTIDCNCQVTVSQIRHRLHPKIN